MSNTKSLTVSKVINADKTTIFEALTNQQLMQQWFFAGPDGWSSTVKSASKVGSQYQIDMHDDQGNTYSHTGEYKEVIPNDRLVFTWNSQAVTDTLVTITLTEVEGGTEVKLLHEFMPNDEMVKNHTNGWTAILERLGNIAVTQN